MGNIQQSLCTLHLLQLAQGTSSDQAHHHGHKEHHHEEHHQIRPTTTVTSVNSQRRWSINKDLEKAISSKSWSGESPIFLALMTNFSGRGRSGCARPMIFHVESTMFYVLYTDACYSVPLLYFVLCVFCFVLCNAFAALCNVHISLY